MSNAQRILLVVAVLLLAAGGVFAALYFSGVFSPSPDVPDPVSSESQGEPAKTSADPQSGDASADPETPDEKEEVWSEDWTQTKDYDKALFSEFDRQTDADDPDATVVCDGKDAAVEGKNRSGVTAENGTVSVTKGGTYILRGTYKGRILVKVAETEKVRLVFDNFSITCAAYTPILCASADKLAIILPEGTVNEVVDSGSGYVKGADEQEEIEGRSAGAIHAKCDLTINGNGKLVVKANYRHGIFSKNDLRILAGRIEVTASSSGIKGKGSVTVGGGSIHIESDGDAFKVTETQKLGKGTFTMTDGVVTCVTKADGVDAMLGVSMDGGRMSLTAADHAITSDGSIDVRGEDTVLRLASTNGGKGIRAFGDINIINGDIRISQAQEGISSTAKSVLIKNGKLRLHTTEEGLDAAVNLTVAGGDIAVFSQNSGIGADGRVNQTGGTLYVCGPAEGNGGIVELVTGDGKSGTWTVSGGLFVGCGNPGEDNTPSDKSGQVCVRLYGDFKGDSFYSLKGADGVLMTFRVPQDCSVLLLSGPDLKEETLYTLLAGVTPKEQPESGGGICSDPSSEGGTEVSFH